MNNEYIIILLLSIIICLLFWVILNSKKKIDTPNNPEIDIINKNIESLLNKTLEQSGYVNSKIDEIGDLTKKMTNAMTTNISEMGDMGEVILENILEECGMTKNRDYKTQFTGKNEEGAQLRPDVVIFLPENRNIIIDSKVPMKDWYNFQNSDDKDFKNKSIIGFISAVKNHINAIYKKDYKNLLNINSPDYVFIFMPHEFAFVTAQKFDTSLANFAQQKQIIIVGPSTLIMCMKLIESIWKLEKQNKNSSEIANLAGQMYDQIVKSINTLEDSEKNLIKATDSVSNAKKYIKDGRGSLYNKAEEMRKLGANNKKELNIN
ncbi:DNA recombination protein RmuC [Alphaproteobacteria bacterium]|jgi:DNA recombination protein RmuC|nr:DNA recombination protein RmuC [Alphaproteobacteria bacterium]